MEGGGLDGLLAGGIVTVLVGALLACRVLFVGRKAGIAREPPAVSRGGGDRDR